MMDEEKSVCDACGKISVAGNFVVTSALIGSCRCVVSPKPASIPKTQFSSK